MRLNEKNGVPRYELFFAPLQISLSTRALERVEFAYQCSKYGHMGQYRDGGSRYFDHPKAAAWIYIHELGGRDARAIIDSLLHDLSEDTRLLSPYRISLNFGQAIASDVRALTKIKKGRKETTDEYLARVIVQGPWCIVAKLCDRLHNLRTLEDCPLDKQRSQIVETEKYHLSMLIPALARCKQPWAGYTALLDEKIRTAIAAHKARIQALAA